MLLGHSNATKWVFVCLFVFVYSMVLSNRSIVMYLNQKCSCCVFTWIRIQILVSDRREPQKVSGSHTVVKYPVSQTAAGIFTEV